MSMTNNGSYIYSLLASKSIFKSHKFDRWFTITFMLKALSNNVEQNLYGWKYRYENMYHITNYCALYTIRPFFGRFLLMLMTKIFWNYYSLTSINQSIKYITTSSISRLLRFKSIHNFSWPNQSGFDKNHFCLLS